MSHHSYKSNVLKQARTTPITSRKPDSMQGRPRGNVSRVSVGTVVANGGGKDTSRINSVRPRRSGDVKEKGKETAKVKEVKTDDGVEVARRQARDGDAGDVNDSIAARLDQWETQDERQRLEQTTEGKRGFVIMTVT